jgi:hypothetical protein
MPFKLKDTAPNFEMVDGPFEGRRFRQGETYDEIPAEYKDRFEKVKSSPETQVKPEPAAAEKGGTEK